MKVLPVPGWRPMKHLAVRVHFLQCGGLLDDWSVLWRPEPSPRVNDISQIQWSQHFLTTQLERHNWRATRLANKLPECR
ncbi:hypothetical protein TNCV_4487971 [Trichonephila clavipes]|nr:hypothetical protein TNCV_4487971 [Trichonephila clavipes]